MNYNTVADIYASIDETRGRFVARVETLSEAEQNFRPAEGHWSVAEIVEHLSLIEGGLTQLMGMMLNKIESAAGPPPETRHVEMAPFTLAHFIEQAREEKYQAPEIARPRGGVAIADSLARMKDSRQRLHALRPRVEARDLSAALYPHPAFGPLNLYQWLAFIGIHEARHLGQIERLLKTNDE
ncbi:MAG: DinB family protein [Pyrinomonadaceae bacterium]